MIKEYRELDASDISGLDFDFEPERIWLSKETLSEVMKLKCEIQSCILKNSRKSNIIRKWALICVLNEFKLINEDEDESA